MESKDIIQKYKLNRSSWTKKGFHGILHYFFPICEMPFKYFKAYFGQCFTNILFYIEEEQGHWAWNDDDLTRIRKAFVKRVNADPNFLDNLLKEWHDRIANFNRIIKEVDGTDLSKLSDEKLTEFYENWNQAYLREYAIAATMQEAFSFQADQFLLPHFQKIITEKVGEDKIGEYLSLLTHPVEHSFLTMEHKELLLLSKDPSEDKLRQHVKKWHWIENNYARDTCLDIKHFRKNLKDIKDPMREITKIDLNLKEIKEKKAALIELLKLDQESKNLIKMTEICAYMQDERKSYVLKSVHYQRMFIEEFGKRLRLTQKQMEYTIHNELADLLKSRPDHRIFEERRKGVLVIHREDGFELITGQTAKDIMKTLFEKNLSKIKELKGIIACRGKISGTAKIVLTKEDMHKVKKGDIIIASMTRPEIMPAIAKAAAIVTDEGGITSHAAIVSRELHIPCVLATKDATKVFKDGDVVEVDADKGVVKLLSRPKNI